jgi:cyclopropane-fatty-acyl-phospholipid synthase
VFVSRVAEHETDSDSSALLTLAKRLDLPGERIAVRLWNGAALETEAPPVATIRVRSPRALAELVTAPGELGLARAFVRGDLDVDGDLEAALAAGRRALAANGRPPASDVVRAARAILATGALRGRRRPPSLERRLAGRRHSRVRDAAAIAHHYDAPEDFYRLILGPSMTYSCAYFREPEMGLEAAQEAKHDLILRKLGLGAEARLLDVGCGWGSLALRAGAAGVRVVGVTISADQARVARRRVAETGLGDRVEIRLQDYRDVRDGPYDAVASVGMVEHVGRRNLSAYYRHLHALLGPGGRLLNHGITGVRDRPFGRRSFIQRYVFPDGELHRVSTGVTTMEAASFEIRDVESLREHYARTLRCWVRNLETSFAQAARLAGVERARAWRLYMSGSAAAFAEGRIGLHQILGVVPAADGTSGMPPTRVGLA